MRRISELAIASLLLPLFSSGCFSQVNPAPLTLREFEELSLALSEEPGYFDTDNLITNEDSFQHVVPTLRSGGIQDGAYLGVGPDQNFTYILQVEPIIAFIVDVRRENLLFHLYLKELILSSRNRADFLTRLLGCELTSPFNTTLDAAGLLDQLSVLPVSPGYFEQVFSSTWDDLRKSYPRLVAESDRNTLQRMMTNFVREGLDLRFRSHGRLPGLHYPTLKRLILETDQHGHRWHYLNREGDFRRLQKLQEANRIVPVIADLAGDSGLKSVAGYLRSHQIELSVFYLSNVEYYLFRNGRHGKFVENLKAFSAQRQALLIRSYFGRGSPHPEHRAGYLVTSVTQPLERFLRLEAERHFRSYADLVLADSSK